MDKNVNRINFKGSSPLKKGLRKKKIKDLKQSRNILYSRNAILSVDCTTNELRKLS